MSAYKRARVVRSRGTDSRVKNTRTPPILLVVNSVRVNVEN